MNDQIKEQIKHEHYTGQSHCFWIVSKGMFELFNKNIGLTFYYSHLTNQQGKYKKNWFFISNEKIEKQIGIHRNTQRKYCNILKKMGILKTKQNGGSSRTISYKINFKKANDLMEEKQCQIYGKQCTKNVHSNAQKMCNLNNTSYYHINNKNINKKPPYIPPNGKNGKSSHLKNKSNSPAELNYKNLLTQNNINLKEKSWLSPKNLTLEGISPQCLNLFFQFKAPYVDSKRLFSVFCDYYHERKEKGSELTYRAHKIAINKIKDHHSTEDIIETYEKSIECGYRGFFPSEEKNKNQRRKTQPKKEMTAIQKWEMENNKKYEHLGDENEN